MLEIINITETTSGTLEISTDPQGFKYRFEFTAEHRQRHTGGFQALHTAADTDPGQVSTGIDERTGNRGQGCFGGN